MRYKKAQELFPQELIKEIQNYAEGEYIYIPRKEGHRRQWGETTRGHIQTAQRNRLIYADACTGMRTQELAEKYFLSEKTIQRIVLQEKRK